MASPSSPTLLDIMTIALDLHPEHLASSGIASLKLLRLVSRGFCRLARTAVKSCNAHIGYHCASPSLIQLLRFAEANLQTLNLTLTIHTGETSNHAKAHVRR